jgi:hypothetical protein|tara:strand:+ start:185 stop:439 length:255 start_codon:yes stop_codon:yes gene_type:complete
MSFPLSKAKSEAEFMAQAGSAVEVISGLLNKEVLREDTGEDAALNNWERGGLLDALSIIGRELVTRSCELDEFTALLVKEGESS